MKATARIRIKFESKGQLDSVFKALEPETRSSVSDRSKVTIAKEDNTLSLFFEAKDTSALRAAVNSYLHWVRLTKNVLNSLRTS